jgi:sugar-specific transcriptional regulator TrmB
VVYLGNEEDLKKIGLTKYEAKAYLFIIKHQIANAKAICRDEDIPYGKIYETLGSLINLGFIEVQNTRPKQYRAIKAAIAFETFISERKKKVETELVDMKEMLQRLGENLSQKNKVTNEDTIFLKIAFGKDIIRMLVESFDNADKDINMFFMAPLSSEEVEEVSDDLVILLPKISSLLKRGLKFRMLQDKHMPQELWDKIRARYRLLDKKNLVRQTDAEIGSFFMIMDGETVITRITNPLKYSETFALVKIWSPDLACKLNIEFMELWNKAKAHP